MLREIGVLLANEKANRADDRQHPEIGYHHVIQDRVPDQAGEDRQADEDEKVRDRTELPVVSFCLDSKRKLLK